MTTDTKITFVTGNQNKADYLARLLGVPIDHIKLNLDEIQSISRRVKRFSIRNITIKLG